MPKAPCFNESQAATPISVDGTALHVCTRDLPSPQRLPYLREVFGRQVVRVDIETLDDDPLDYEATLLGLPGLQVLWSATQTPARWSRTAEFLQDGNDDFVLFLHLDGALQRSQRGIDLNLQCGEAASFLHEEPAGIQFGPSKSLALMLPRTEISPMVRQLEQSAKHLIPNSEALSLLRSYALLLRDNMHLVGTATSNVIASHVYDLVAVAVGATKESQEVASSRGIRAARLKAIKAFVLRSRAWQGLSVSAVARHHKLTTRYIHMLFEDEGVTFSGFVIEQRLQLAHDMLRSKRCAPMSISAIAFASGFSDLSHFNRSFRRRFGATPSEVRVEKGRQETGR